MNSAVYHSKALSSASHFPNMKKPIVSDNEYLAAIGALYNLSDQQISNAHRPYEAGFRAKINEHVATDAPYLIEPKTHRIWLTSPSSPKEAPLDRLSFYEKSLEFYDNLPFEHHFWCNGVHLIPQTIAAIRNFSTPVIIHDISEVADQFITKNLFTRFLNDNHFCYAGDLAKQEIVLQQGGLYADIGLEQKTNLEPYFKKYEELFFSAERWGSEGGSAVGARKNLPHLRNSLVFASQIERLIPQLSVIPSRPRVLVGLHIWTAWRINWALEAEQKTNLGFIYLDVDFDYHGFASWHNPGTSELYNFTINYYLDFDKK